MLADENGEKTIAYTNKDYEKIVTVSIYISPIMSGGTTDLSGTLRL